jgi:hypothetical protein
MAFPRNFVAILYFIGYGQYPLVYVLVFCFHINVYRSYKDCKNQTLLQEKKRLLMISLVFEWTPGSTICYATDYSDRLF